MQTRLYTSSTLNRDMDEIWIFVTLLYYERRNLHNIGFRIARLAEKQSLQIIRPDL